MEAAMSKSDYVVVPPSEIGSVAGALTYWRISGATNRAAIMEQRGRAGLDPKLDPRPTSPETALRLAALDIQQSEKGKLIRPMHPGWAVVTEWQERVPFENARLSTMLDDNGEPIWINDVGDRLDPDTFPLHLRHRHDYYIHFGVDGDLDVDAMSDEGRDNETLRRRIAHAVNDRYEHYLTSVTDISAWLVKIAYTCKAVALRDTGGFYFIPRTHLPEWKAEVAAVRLATRHQIFEIPALSTAEAVAAILDAFMTEVDEAANAMETDVETIGKRAAKTRMGRSEKLVEKAAEYEQILGVDLSALRDRMERLQASLAEIALAGEEDA